MHISQLQKIKWILDNVDGARDKAEKGELLFGTVDTWLAWKLSMGATHVTDVSNASRTLLFNIRERKWDKELMELFTIPESMLPEVKSSSEVYGHANNSGQAEIPIAGIAGDQQSALFGQMCVDKGMVKNTYGTGCFLMLNTGETPIESKNNLLTTIAWELDGKLIYALEGSVYIGGAVVQWLRDGLMSIESSAAIERHQKKANYDSDGVYFVPAFTGLGAPYWDQYARGAIMGLTRGSTKYHIGQAAVESIAFQSADVLEAMEADAGIDIGVIRADGGASANNHLMQFQADVMKTKVIRPKNLETTALGAAYLAGLAVGFWKDVEEIKSMWQKDREFEPDMPDAEVEKRIKGWKKAVQRTLDWEK